MLMGEVARAERELAAIAPQVGKSIPADSVPAMTILQVQARLDAARGRWPQAVGGLTRIVDFFDGRRMAVAPLARVLILRGELHLAQGNTGAAKADAARALEVARALQGDKPHSSLTGQSLLLEARIQATVGEDATARQTAKQAVAHLAETLAADHPDTRRAREGTQG